METEWLVLGGQYESRDDFAVVLQPFFQSTVVPMGEVSVKTGNHVDVRVLNIYYYSIYYWITSESKSPDRARAYGGEISKNKKF